MRLSAKLWQLPILIGLSACSSLSGDIPGNTSIVPKGSLHIFPKYAVTHADIVQVGLLLAAVYMVTDPTAPNWEIVETRLPDNRVLYKLSMQYLHVGGDGEARYVLARRAEALAREQGLGGYQIQRYEEAVDSRILLPQRTAYAEVQLLAAR
ncbi:hypothetical protein Q9Q94_08485 [Uliginosibacterium sp. 31-16]|uniref:hypothetical protein n=1 Tax=Uliginosibacterium sp. 31-16 TaxID=3068315 RepID=UPI00273F0BE0|nr:hypothetical protein [Uliginosibacterium sp. 31-16]MDP5239564.1 hypothetical protein [Uliginosibacterium sp. 31-16]